MADKDSPRDFRTLIAQFRTSEHWAVSLARDLLWVACVVGGIALALFLICGTWPAVVTIESGSMVPNMNIGDLVVVVQKDRYGELMSWEEGKAAGVPKFNSYGDVLIFRPNGNTVVHPIIHRAVAYVKAGTPITEIRGNQLVTNYTADHDGYITWGDHNPYPDQFSRYEAIGTPEPVKDEWIVGKALFTVPLVGYLPLHIWEVVIVVVIIMALHELWLRSREEKKEKGSGQKKRQGKRK
ncbi:S24/S26 family peptidase [Methanoregula formicica]|uniref:Signal peptidase I n=1 Tax=Methanoregula formicica (strain DSM 22288 / NBRC 105244 / SMSP) TaxID=593750 RepID=L0H926_METFS|nr:S26 family signal peptidase [Methanoregula formicica]AGB01222.1 signal peptidase I [Methanoregula formicica SMSP]